MIYKIMIGLLLLNANVNIAMKARCLLTGEERQADAASVQAQVPFDGLSPRTMASNRDVPETPRVYEAVGVGIEDGGLRVNDAEEQGEARPLLEMDAEADQRQYQAVEIYDVCKDDAEGSIVTLSADDEALPKDSEDTKLASSDESLLVINAEQREFGAVNVRQRAQGETRNQRYGGLLSVILGALYVSGTVYVIVTAWRDPDMWSNAGQ